VATPGSGDELGAALVLLGASGVALAMALRGICAIFQRRERDTGRRLSADEVESLLTVAAAHPVLADQVRGMRGDLDDLTDKLDELLRRSRRRPATDQ
jgi:hypothetical protein